MSSAPALQRLQEADGRLAALGAQAEALAAEIDHDVELDRLRVEAAGAGEAHRLAEQESAAAEARAAELRRRAAGLERRLYDGSVGNPQELIAMQHELEAIRQRLTAEEDELLARMEVAEAAAGTALAADRAAADRERARAAAAGPNAERLVSLRAELEGARADREEIAAGTAAAELALYSRLSSRLRPVVVRLQGDSCGGCRHGLGMREVHAVRVGEGIVQCPDCDRILVP